MRLQLFSDLTRAESEPLQRLVLSPILELPDRHGRKYRPLWRAF